MTCKQIIILIVVARNLHELCFVCNKQHTQMQRYKWKERQKGAGTDAKQDGCQTINKAISGLGSGPHVRQARSVREYFIHALPPPSSSCGQPVPSVGVNCGEAASV
jgi:hypothetical protein